MNDTDCGTHVIGSLNSTIWRQMANGRRFQIGELPLRRGTINLKTMSVWWVCRICV
jgi:hypothetical protein